MKYNPLLVRACKHDFGVFAEKMFHIIFPGKKFEYNWHLDAMAHVARELIAGRTLSQLVSMPPRFLKSYYFSIALPAYLLGQDPTTKIIVSTYTDSLSESLTADTLRLMNSDLYREMFPHTVLAKQTSRSITTTAGGSRFATTVGGAVTGLGGDYIIVDDALNATHAYSDALRRHANDYFTGTLSSRTNKPGEARFIVVMQRLHEADLVGHLLEQGGWEHLKLQAEATEDAIIDVGGGRQHRVTAGDLLHPVRMSKAYLDRQRLRLGSSAFEAQFQQNPVPVDGNQIKSKWLHRYTSLPPKEGGIIVQSWDTASKTGVANDYSVCTTWFLKDGISWLMDVFRAKLEFPDLRKKIDDLWHREGCTHLLIEDASSGAAMIQDLRVSSPYNVIAIPQSKLSKPARVDAISGALEAGRVLFPERAPWLPTFLHEILAFPGRHDDQVDSLTQYVMWMGERSTSYFIADFDKYQDPTPESIAQILANFRFK